MRSAPDEERSSDAKFYLISILCKASRLAASEKRFGHYCDTKIVVITELEVVMNFRTFFTISTDRSTVVRAVKIALIVGVVLVAVNEGNAILHGDIDMIGWIRAGMNFVVPYCVSTVSTVLAQAETNTNETKSNGP